MKGFPSPVLGKERRKERVKKWQGGGERVEMDLFSDVSLLSMFLNSATVLNAQRRLRMAPTSTGNEVMSHHLFLESHLDPDWKYLIYLVSTVPVAVRCVVTKSCPALLRPCGL